MAYNAYINTLNYKYEKLINPIVVSEEDGEVEVIEMIEELNEGVYELIISFVSSYASRNDKLHFRFGGSNPSPNFLKEAKDALEVLPWSYSFPYIHSGGVFSLSLICWIEGIGISSVGISGASITIKKVS